MSLDVKIGSPASIPNSQRERFAMHFSWSICWKWIINDDEIIKLLDSTDEFQVGAMFFRTAQNCRENSRFCLSCDCVAGILRCFSAVSSKRVPVPKFSISFYKTKRLDSTSAIPIVFTLLISATHCDPFFNYVCAVLLLFLVRCASKTGRQWRRMPTPCPPQSPTLLPAGVGFALWVAKTISSSWPLRSFVIPFLISNYRNASHLSIWWSRGNP